jgi:long-chain acyl-CoA synthetase
MLTPVLSPGDPILSILPYAHIYENANIYGYFAHRVVIYINTHMDKLVEDLRDVRPVIVYAVPRVFERILVGIRTRAKNDGGLRGRLIPWALDIGREYMRRKTAGRPTGPGLAMQYGLAEKIVYGKLRTLLGLNHLAFFGSGSAPLHPDTALTFMAFGVTILEGYGLTECSPVVTASPPGVPPVVGSVGPPISNVEVKLAEDGELLVRGPSVMKGYYHDPEATAAVFTGDWFHTGDIAEIDSNGYVRITDRKKELFKTSGGKFIAPSRVESAIARSIYVNQAMVIGNGRPHPAALISPNWPNVRAELILPADIPVSELLKREDVQHFMRAEVMAQTGGLGSFEQIRRVSLLPRDLTIEDGELSPTQKIKRRVVEQRYADLIEALFTTAV